LGNLAFQSDNGVFVGHAKLPRALALLGSIYLQRASAQAGHRLDPEHIVAPDRTVRETIDLDLGNRILRVTAHAPAHTDHDLSVYDEKTGTLWTGDLVFMEHLPVIDGSINGWLEVLGNLIRVPATRVVPGHGPVQAHWPVAADGTLRYLSALREEIRVWIAHGRDLRSAQEHVGYRERSNWVLFDHHHQRNVATAFNELEWED
jgi:quinoprotein relay system zinc metallohydrolase 2